MTPERFLDETHGLVSEALDSGELDYDDIINLLQEVIDDLQEEST